MTTSLLDHYAQASRWTLDRVAGARDLDAATPCDAWQVRDLLNHMLQTQQYFLGAATGEDATPPGPTPPSLLSGDPHADFTQARSDVLEAFGQEGVVDKTGPMLGIAFSDQLLHGWDRAQATGQDATMPEGLAEASYECIHGAFTDEQRKGVFGPEIEIGPEASAQEKLLAYTGRRPS